MSVNFTIIAQYSYCGTNSSRYVETFMANNKRFRVDVGTSCEEFIGYNYNCHIEAWTENGWAKLADDLEAGITSYRNIYEASENEKMLMTAAVVGEFKDFIKKWMGQ